MSATSGVKAPPNKEKSMNLTLLLDLDDTLLDTNVDTFVPAYFQALSDFLKDQVEPELMLSALMSGTRKMTSSNDPSRTLRQVFDAEFFPTIGIAREELQPRIDLFYKEVFPTLSYLTNPWSEAVEAVKWALSLGATLAVATNPLFPLTAIRHRMRWAGLPPEEYPFAVVSAYETFHFAKPNPAFFAEVLGRIGWPDGPIVMVGDDVIRDLTGSNVLGLAAYWINTNDATLPEGITLAGRGSIGDLRPWLEQTDLSAHEHVLSTPESLLALLTSTPAAISGLLPCLSDREQASGPDLKRRPMSSEWCLTEILCHLRDTEIEVNQPRLRMLLELNEPFIPARNTDKWAEERGYKNQDPISAFDDFLSARLGILGLLRGLTNEWEHKARHAIFGPTNLLELVKFMAEHDKLHLRQIYTTIGHLED
ncbi:MAG: HAD family hydrolase [Anaerolineales bacterium]|jgi:FMN phosphatase YigB (HAD superfamily)